MNEGREDIFVVINIGSSWLSGILAQKSAEGRVRPLHACRVPAAGAIRQGYIHNIEAATRAIGQIIDELDSQLGEDARITGVYVGLDCRSMCSETFVSSRTLGSDSSREIKQEDLDQLREQVGQAEFPGMHILAITDPRYLVDGRREYTPRGVMGRYIEAHYKVIVVRQNIFAHLEETFARLELKILGTLPTPLVEARATLTAEESALGCAYVNMGGGTTSIALYKERLLAGLYIIPLGGQCVTRDLAYLSTPLLEKDAEQLKIHEGSMDTSIPQSEYIERTSPESGKSIHINRLELNRFVDARIRELLWNALHIIHESGNEANVSRGLIFAGGVTRTSYFYETLEQLGFEYRRGTLRREIYDPRLEQTESGIGKPQYLRDYMTELALAWWAQKPGVEYQLQELDKVMGVTEPSPAPQPKPEPEPEELTRPDDDYSFDPLSEEQSSQIAAIEVEQEQVEQQTLQEPKKHRKALSWVGTAISSTFKSLFSENRSEEDDDEDDEDDGEIRF